MRLGARRVIAFVDWDTARRTVRPSLRRRQPTVEDAIEHLSERIARRLKEQYADPVYRVSWRLYHGWYRGLTKTDDRRAFDRFCASSRGRVIDGVSFENQFGFSDLLLCGHTPVLYDSLRADRNDSSLDRQKMVDTALACDVLHTVRTERTTICLIIADDDDMIPVAMTARAWNGEAVLLRARAEDNRHIDVSGLVVRLN